MARPAAIPDASSPAEVSPACIRLPHCVLPPDRAIIITIDGPAGTGKSSVARTLARRLGLEFLDTGAMYRAAAALALDEHLTLSTPGALVDHVARADLHFDWQTDPPTLMAFERPCAARLRDPDVNDLVSRLAALPELRRLMVAEQRLIAAEHPRLVTEGRDQGTVVFPDAPVKFYLDAAPEVRAMRRVRQLSELGIAADADAVLHEIIQRDHQDSTRADGPLRCPDDAIRIDTSALTLAGVVDELARHVHARFPAP